MIKHLKQNTSVRILKFNSINMQPFPEIRQKQQIAIPSGRLHLSQSAGLKSAPKISAIYKMAKGTSISITMRHSRKLGAGEVKCWLRYSAS